MSISSSLYIGTTGIIAQQTNMSVISDNISNVSTVGFKSSRALFQNMLSEQLTGATVGNQVGQGATVSSIYRNMAVGTLETSSTATDIAIGGNGFFMVSPEGSAETYYTRAGSFRFDKDGYLRDPQGNILQGYKMPARSILDDDIEIPTAENAVVEDIQLQLNDAGNGIVSEPEATSELRMMVNLDSNAENGSSSETSPFTAMFNLWNGNQEPPISAANYAYETSLKIYDSAGNPHIVTTYFDPANADIQDNTNGYSVWEFAVTVPPDEDASGLNEKKGILMAGTLSFTPSGDIVSMTAFQGDTDDPASWTPVEFSDDGYPLLRANLVGADPIVSKLDIGITAQPGWAYPEGTNLGNLGANYADLPKIDNSEKNVLSISNFNSASSTIYQSQNGYERGFLQSVSIDTDGVILGNFSNGQDQNLFKIPLADFINPQGLFREGGNLYSATQDSGAATTGWAGDGRLGAIAPNSLEGSNVDLATEFVNMISTQKAFDANSKVISTADQVVQTALGIKK